MIITPKWRKCLCVCGTALLLGWLIVAISNKGGEPKGSSNGEGEERSIGQEKLGDPPGGLVAEPNMSKGEFGWLNLDHSLSLRGKVVDENDVGVSGAEVSYSVFSGSALAVTKQSNVYTDASGNFSVSDISGTSVNINAYHEGYFTDPKESFAKVWPMKWSGAGLGREYAQGQTIVLRLHSIGETEPLITHRKVWATFSESNNLYYDLKSGSISTERSRSNTVIQIEIVPPPEPVGSMKVSEWSAIVRCPGGGIQERGGAKYDYIAPDKDYDVALRYNRGKPAFAKEFYLEFSGGLYGRCKLEIDGGLRSLSMEYSRLNLTGSRNLTPPG